MLTVQDYQQLVQSNHSAEFLVRHLQVLTQSATPFLADITRELYEECVKVERKLNRLESLVRESDKEKAVK